MLAEHTRFFAYPYQIDQAEMAIFGVPFDCTTSNKPGTRFAPARMRLESINLETYSPDQNLDLADLKVADLGDLICPFGNARKVLDLVYQQTEYILEQNKMPIMIGGEHLLTLGAVEAMNEKYSDLQLVQLDAHTDLRDEYLGEKLSHATVIKHCYNLLGADRIHAYGIRSGMREEFEFAEQNLNFNPFDLKGMSKLKDKLQNKPVYVTLDLDVLDPAFFPGTGTPEPGGVTFKELLSELFTLQDLNIVGFDLVELCPEVDPSGISTAAACKVLREMLLIAGKSKNII